MRKTLNGLEPDLLVYDEECAALLLQTTYAKAKLLSYHELPAICFPQTFWIATSYIGHLPED